MLLRRITNHVRKQNWFAVFLDFVIVVVGVFIGIQVSNWNESRAEHAKGQAYLSRIQDDINTDIKNYQNRLVFWGQVYDYGVQGLEYANQQYSINDQDQQDHNGDPSQTISAPNWDLLIAFFQASQIWEFYITSATYDELTSSGDLRLIKNLPLRNALTKYYTYSGNAMMSAQPKYRENVRRLIPIKIQEYIWENCHGSGNTDLQTLVECESPITEEQAGHVVSQLVANHQLMEDLRFWMSTSKITSKIAKDSILEANNLLDVIESELLLYGDWLE